MGLIRKAASLVKSPRTALAYARYHIKPERCYGSFRLGNFSGFSEYLNVDFLNADETRLLTTHPFPEGDIIDVGAHIGFISLLTAKRYPDRRVHAFEATPSTYQSLVNNLKLNGVENVQAHGVAIADREGTLTFNAHPRHRATNSIGEGEHAISVPCTTIDAYSEREGIDKIALLKVDVEGFEHLVLKGAEKMIAKTHMIFYEVCPSNNLKVGTSIQEPFRALTERGFSVYRFGEGVLTPARLSDLKLTELDNWIAINTYGDTAKL